ncbi:type II secretion system protein GspM [Tepidimonas aquatica]|uniref:Type II secretion system (T2SS), protein M n=1 Tax=Tepidimonas aquatica TaxID=247482 RepID=A0A554WW87_9BURK|nr:type II secretion system protein GspM [Tepidimonas aquatica]TSE27842.1 Type II secretion system (T2SS), protein M [Tepidimonas aquatica]
MSARRFVPSLPATKAALTALAPRRWAVIAAVLLALYGIGVVVPAWRTLQQAPDAQARARAELQRVTALAQALADARRSATTGPAAAAAVTVDTAALLDLSTRWLGPETRVTRDGDGWVVQWQRARAEGLATWLPAVRTQLRLVPTGLQAQHDAADGSWRGQARLQSPGGAR